MMIDFCSLNIRGLNNKKAFVKDFLSLNKISFVAILETHVKRESSTFVSREVSSRLTWIYNYENHYNGRIWVGYDTLLWTCSVLNKSAQQITCSMQCLSTGNSFVVSFIYGLNTHMKHRALWSELLLIQNSIGTGVIVGCYM